MKHVSTWLMALALSLPLSANGDTMTKDQDAVQTTIMTMTNALVAGDIDTVMSTYAPEATVLFDPETPTTDAAELAEMFTGMAQANPQFDFGGHEIVVNGDTAVHIAPWAMTGTLPDGTKIAQSGLSVAVLRRQADGSWKMVIDNPYGGRLLDAAH